MLTQLQPTDISSTIQIIVDVNIAHLDDYFNAQVLATDVNVIKMAGRDITADIIEQYQPHALLIRSVTQINQALLKNNHSIKYIGSATIGTDHIDQAYLASRNIAFANASGSSKHSVAQYVMTAILSLQERLPKLNKDTSYLPRPYLPIPPTLGIIGLGNIGQALIHYAQSMGWRIIGYDPFFCLDKVVNMVSVDTAKIKQVDELSTLLTQADIVSLHVPLTYPATELNHPVVQAIQQKPSNVSTVSTHPTYHLIDETTLAMMKPTAILINSSRGAVIKESALIADIQQTNRPVVLDVFEHEPMVSAELIERLAIATPHIAGYTLEGKLRGTQMIYEAFCHSFGLSCQQTMSHFIPKNPYHWENLRADSSQLDSFYPIHKDHQQLYDSIDTQTAMVSATDFDALRKNYHLRREWLF